MSRRWKPPAPPSPQESLFPRKKPATDTSLAAMESVGLVARASLPAIFDKARAHAREAMTLADTVNREIVEYLRERPDGATPDEIAYAIKHSPFTVRPRCSELKRAGVLRDTLERRENQSGRRAAVLVLAQRELAATGNAE